MENKIQELAEKIYKDGVAKAQTEADDIIAKAERLSKEVVEQAREKAAQIVSSATEESERLRNQSVTEIRDMVHSAEEALKTKITDLINSQAVNASIDETFAKPETLYKVVLEMAQHALNGDTKSLEISTSDAKGIEEYIRTKAQSLLQSGVTIKEVAGKATSFDISSEEWNYRINVSKEAFSKYFTEFMRPRMHQILFGNEEA